MSPETRALLDQAVADCHAATGRHRLRERDAMLAGIRDQWKAAADLPRVPGHDPLVVLGVIAE